MNDAPDQLPVILLTAQNAAVPALIAARGPHAGRRARSARRPPLRRILHREHQEPEHAPSLLPSNL